jgi:nucleoid DNA-binding protein
MNKEQLIDAIAKESELSKTDCKNFLNAYAKVVQDTLVSGEPIQQTGFATFAVKHRAQRKGTNPQTKKEIIIPASNVVKVTIGKQLKEAISNSKATPTKKGKK